LKAIVCDSNIYISAIVFGGSPRDVLALAEQGKILLLVSPALISEVEGVLEDKFEWELRRIRQICRPLWKIAKRIDPVSDIAECRDRKDNHILALAVDGAAVAIVTGDKDLQVLHPFRGIQIMTAAQFLASAYLN